MAPSASMLLLSYHQLHRSGEEKPRGEEGVGGGVRLRLGFSSAFASLGVFSRRRAAAAEVTEVGAEGKGRRGEAAGDEEEAAAALEGRFEEALRLSCWSS